MNLRFLVCLWLFCTAIYGQDSISLISCYQKALENYPVFRDKMLNKQASDLRLKNVNAGWYPQFSLSAQSTYQSDVPHIISDKPLPFTMPSAPKDQYKIALDLSQTIFDGGYAKSQKVLENASLLTDVQQVEIELYQLKDRINGIYFSILLLGENEKLLVSTKQTIDDKLKTLESALRNGLLTNADKDVLVAESLKLDQTIFELCQDRANALEMLSELTGQKYSDSQIFQVPRFEFPDTSAAIRPEQVFYNLQMQKIDASMQLAGSKMMPRLGLFSQLGYGNPGLNMLNDKFSTYYIIGASLKWTFWDWNSTKREKEVLKIQKDMVADKKGVFELNRSIALKNELSRIKKFRKSTEMNSQLVELRKGITRVASSRLSAGTLTSTDYLNELNAQVQAQLNLEISQISLVQSQVNYLNIRGEK
jgi:outer membrane protein TolC